MLCERMDNEYNSMEWVCDFTRECDKYLVWKHEFNKTYIFDADVDLKEVDDEDKKIYLVFRTPGATRGHLVLNQEHVIEAIKFYADTSFGANAAYNRDVVKATEKFIGQKIEITE